jgi:hypothetical protein
MLQSASQTTLTVLAMLTTLTTLQGAGRHQYVKSRPREEKRTHTHTHLVCSSYKIAKVTKVTKARGTKSNHCDMANYPGQTPHI